MRVYFRVIQLLIVVNTMTLMRSRNDNLVYGHTKNKTKQMGSKATVHLCQTNRLLLSPQGGITKIDRRKVIEYVKLKKIMTKQIFLRLK